ncbi:glutathione S-transferase family protein [Chitinibacter sp. SCUT-21]|uniref:glutathione S-transferase family protein n=1 Tax=Chitinibacter sp. SCUT-21 TaxID=2970891 RepID=UPI0035A587B7
MAITVYGFGPGYGLPDISPFVLKTMVLLKMANLPYEVNVKGYGNAPKAKLPYLNDDGQIIADSTFIYWHLEHKYQLDLNAWLSEAEQAVAWAFEKMLEEHLYWTVLYERWVKERNFKLGPYRYFRFLPWPLRDIVPKMVRRKLKKSLIAQGIGRHNEADILRLAKKDLDAIDDFLADKRYLMGDRICASDATVYAFCQSALCELFSGELQQYAASKQNMVAYVQRMQHEYGF